MINFAQSPLISTTSNSNSPCFSTSFSRLSFFAVGSDGGGGVGSEGSPGGSDCLILDRPDPLMISDLRLINFLTIELRKKYAGQRVPQGIHFALNFGELSAHETKPVHKPKEGKNQDTACDQSCKLNGHPLSLRTPHSHVTTKTLRTFNDGGHLETAPESGDAPGPAPWHSPRSSPAPSASPPVASSSTRARRSAEAAGVHRRAWPEARPR